MDLKSKTPTLRLESHWEELGYSRAGLNYDHDDDDFSASVISYCEKMRAEIKSTLVPGNKYKLLFESIVIVSNLFYFM